MNRIRHLVILTIGLGASHNISFAQYEIGRPYSESYRVMQYCCAPCEPKSKLEHSLNVLPIVVKNSLQSYWTMNFDSLFLKGLTFKHVQIIRCVWQDDSLSQKVRYEIGYLYSDSARGINAYNIQLVFDSLGNINRTKYPHLAKLNEANFPRNKGNVSKLFLLDKSRVDAIVERNKLFGGRLFYNALYEEDRIDKDTMIWEFVKRKGKKRYRVYVDAFTGEILREELILPPPPRY